jgi:hypothetical protein
MTEDLFKERFPVYRRIFGFDHRSAAHILGGWPGEDERRQEESCGRSWTQRSAPKPHSGWFFCSDEDNGRS